MVSPYIEDSVIKFLIFPDIVIRVTRMSITIVGIQVVSKVVGEVFTKVCGNDINDDDDVKCY